MNGTLIVSNSQGTELLVMLDVESGTARIVADSIARLSLYDVEGEYYVNDVSQWKVTWDSVTNDTVFRVGY